MSPARASGDVFAEHFRTVVREGGSDLAKHLVSLVDELVREHFAAVGVVLPRVVPLVMECSSPRALADHCRRDQHGIEYRIRLAPSTLRKMEKGAEGHRERFVADVLLHELVHVEQHAGQGDGEPGYKGHGPNFARTCNRIGEHLGLAPVGARPRSRRRGVETVKDCASWPICVRPAGYYGTLEDIARGTKPKKSKRVDPLDAAISAAEERGRRLIRQMRSASNPQPPGAEPKDHDADHLAAALRRLAGGLADRSLAHELTELAKLADELALPPAFRSSPSSSGGVS